MQLTFAEPAFAWLEGTSLSQWVRGESLFSFPLILTAHTIGMGFFAGASAAIDFRILGIAPRIPIKPMAQFVPVVWFGLLLNAVSGVFLFIGYPYKAVTNPVFYIKLLCIGLAVFVFLKIRDKVLASAYAEEAGDSAKARRLALLSLLFVVGAITAGRLLAYTFSWLRVGIPGGF